VFARRAAPTQVSWLGYPFSTGLRAMDFRITDWLADPPGAERHYTETVVRLGGPFLCFDPPGAAPAFLPGPFGSAGRLTFGSFNRAAKIGDDAVLLFAAVLRACPGSRLVLKSSALGVAEARRSFERRFVRQGIAPERLTLLGWVTSSDEHFACYRMMDLALDPLPYHGVTTTLEALHMGVPVLSLSGQWHAGRVGTTVLTHAGLGAMVASTPEHLLEMAKLWSETADELGSLRRALRPTLLASALCDEQGFAARFEAALVEAFRERAAFRVD